MPEITQSKHKWEREYQAGRWDYLAGNEEFVRYAIIASHVPRNPESTRVLDVGCGEGILLQHLGPDMALNYTGLDLAQSAVDRIKARRPADRLICSAVEDFMPDDHWDVIIFNEVLYYTADPVAQIKKFEPSLRPGGLMIISIFRKPSCFSPNNRCARAVKAYIDSAGYTVRNAVRLTKIYQKLTWEIFVVQPPRTNEK